MPFEFARPERPDRCEALLLGSALRCGGLQESGFISSIHDAQLFAFESSLTGDRRRAHRCCDTKHCYAFFRTVPSPSAYSLYCDELRKLVRCCGMAVPTFVASIYSETNAKETSQLFDQMRNLHTLVPVRTPATCVSHPVTILRPQLFNVNRRVGLKGQTLILTNMAGFK